MVLSVNERQVMGGRGMQKKNNRKQENTQAERTKATNENEGRKAQ